MKIVVLAGGLSTEREVSLMSGTGVYNALKSKGHDVVMLDVYLGYEGEGVDDIFHVDKDWAADVKPIGSEEPDLDKFKALRKDGGKCFFGPNVIEICKQADVVFLALHGANGEDGRVQAAFELYGIPFTGTDYVSSAICIDKSLSREMLISGGIPMAKGYSIKVGEGFKDMPYPQVIKAANGGSSVGVYIVNNDKERDEAVKNASKFDETLVVEQFIKGREFSCGVIDGKALPIVEIAPKDGFYDFANKYQAQKTKDTCPANLSESKTKELQDICEKAYAVLRIKSYARIDFMMDEDENLYCLEANTLPGMTPTSLLPMEAKAMGMDYPDLCEKLIEVSMKNN